ncbi:WG repeat-containing protein [Bacteroides sp. GM023]|uniref:WG repeat-containing protein n=1 Tax=Bacteroides sp. GM023 TaxID=2723058 RepID=UPI00168AA913|nr:WG repeat-containing protein [Bacteroides sp. GM023]MBD3589513.1 WG repeat-containing protein [Bacteroides sp. GM023]
MRKLFLLCMAIFLLSACGHKEEKVSYLAFKTDVKDRWGIIDQEGKVLFENEFQEEPVAIMNDRFFVKNNEGLYECYTLEEKPKKIGKEYVSIHPFVEDVTPVVEEDQPISFIDKDGKTVCTFDKYENKAVMKITNFSDGLAVFQTEDDLFGYVDTKGKVVIKPQYAGASIFQEKMALVRDKDEKVFAIDRKGKKLFDINTSQLSIFQPYHSGMLVFYTKDKDEPGCLDNKGEKVIKPSSRFDIIDAFEGDVAPVKEGEYWGFINKKGEVLIRAKYQSVNFYNSEFACVMDKDKWGIIDYNGEILCDFECDEIMPFYNGKYAYAKSHDYYVLIDKRGKEINKKEYSFIRYYRAPEEQIESDYLDYEGVLRKELNISMTGADGISFSDTPGVVYNNKDEKYSKEDYRGYSYILYEKDTKYFNLVVASRFPEEVVTPIKERVNYGWGFYDEEIKGYNFNNKQTVTSINIYITGKGKANKKYVNMINAIEKVFIHLGFKVEKKGEGSPILFQFDNKARAMVYKDDNDKILVEYTSPNYWISDDFWQKIKGQNYGTRSNYNLSAEKRFRNTADSIRIADSIAAAEAIAAETAAQNWERVNE